MAECSDDVSGNRMSIEKLNGTNYQSWKFNVKLMLMQKELWGLIDGSDEIEETANEDIKKKYRTRMDKAYSIIALSVETSLQVHIMNTTLPKTAWDILQKQFSFISVTQLVRLTRKFYAASMQEGDDMMKHITYMTQLAQELRDLKEDISNKKFAVVMLGSLPSSYDLFVTSMNAREAETLDWDSVKGSLIEEFFKKKEKQKPVSNSNDEALFTHGGGPSNRNNWRGGGNNNPNGGRGQPGNQYRFSRNRQQTRGGCFNCGDPRHYARDCNAGNNYRQTRPMGNYRNQEESRFVSSFGHLSVENELALAIGENDNNGTEWFIDSAASKHMTSDKALIQDFSKYKEPIEIFLGDNSIILAEGEGTVQLPLYECDQDVTHLTLYKVLYVPDLSKNLVSVTAMTKTGAEVYFDDKNCTVHKDDKQFIIGHAYHGKLYRMNTNREYASMTAVAVNPELWHQRLGHLNKNYMDQLSKGNLATGIKYKVGDGTAECEPCILGKMHKASFPKQSTTKTSRVLELVHSDVCGPIAVESKGGSRYFLTFTDDFSRYSVVYFLHKKSQVLGYFKQYVTQMENFTGVKLQKIRSDNGGEYTSNEFSEYCKQMGEVHEFSNPHTPEQNGVSERLNRTIEDAARSMLIQANLPLSFWAEAVQCAVYIRNRNPTAARKNKTPYECWHKKKPDLSNMRVFGCIAYAHIPDDSRTKLDPKAEKCIFAGYPDGTKGYRLYNLTSRRFIRSRSVIFHEHKFHDFNINKESKKWIYTFPDVNVEEEDQQQENEQPQNENEEPQLPHPTEVNSPMLDQHTIQDDMPVDNEKATYEEEFLRGTRNLQKRVSKPPLRLIEQNEEQCKVTESIMTDDESITLEKALTNENWVDAMRSEMNSLVQNETWELVPRPKDKNIVGNRWVFKVKRNPDGTIHRHKARLVAQGYSQVYGIDYNEVFSPVAKFATIRSLFAFANIEDLEIHQMDVKTAFLNGHLDHEIYMEQPQGFSDPDNPDYVCRLKKSLYGLKQSARCWNETLTDYLVSDGFSKCEADDCLYIKFVGGKFIILAVYVDDVIPISNCVSLLAKEKLKLQQKFDMVDNGEINHILGMLVTRERNKRLLTISQGNYLLDILKRFNMENCNSCSTPLDMGTRFHKFDEENDSRFDITLYQQAIGCLTYAAITTRPDIAAAVGILSQYMSAPSYDHWSGVKRVLRYIKGTLQHGIIFSTNNTNDLIGHSDADWAGDSDTRRSTSGYTFHLGQSLISWSSRKQVTVAKSSTEAEYVALSCATQEAVWLRRLLNDIQCPQNSATLINEDNQGAIELSKNSKHHSRTKHIDTSFHFIRERVVSKEIEVAYCPSGDMIADIMTKALPKTTFEKLRNMLGVYKI